MDILTDLNWFYFSIISVYGHIVTSMLLCWAYGQKGAYILCISDPKEAKIWLSKRFDIAKNGNVKDVW